MLLPAETVEYITEPNSVIIKKAIIMTVVVDVIPCYGGECSLLEHGAFIGNGVLTGLEQLLGTLGNKMAPREGLLVGRKALNYGYPHQHI